MKKLVSKRKARNLEKVMKRWSNNDISAGDQTAEEGRPSMDCSQNTSDNESVENTSNFSPNPTLDSSKTVEKPTGFALYSSYREPVSINNDGPRWTGLVDMRLMVNFLSALPCKNSYCENVQTKLVDNKTVLANTVLMTCSNSGYVNELRTSTRLGDTTPRKLYDVNRRVVKAFTSKGKGHRALETYFMAFESHIFFSHIKALHSEFRKEVDQLLACARNEVRKCFSDINDLEDVVTDVTVSYDGTWQKRGFTSKYGIGCCIKGSPDLSSILRC